MGNWGDVHAEVNESESISDMCINDRFMGWCNGGKQRVLRRKTPGSKESCKSLHGT